MQPTPREQLPVLIVDDDRALAATLTDILRMHGYEPRSAASAQDALRLAAEASPAFAILDLRLPDMDGMELASRLHALSELTEIIVLTGNATLETAISALREHSIDYLLKPVQVEQLLQVVSVAAERWKRRSAQAALEKSEERYRLLFDQNPQPMWVFDRETLRFVAVNDAALRHYGYSRDEFLAMSVEDIRPPEDLPAFRANLAGPQRGKPGVWRHRRKDGSIIDVEVVANDLLFAGRPCRIALAIDVTARLAAERSLQARVRQQAAVAGFGEHALAGHDLGALLNQAVNLVARTLEVPLAAVLERRPDGAAMVLRAGVGWNAGAVGDALIPVSEFSQAGYTLSRSKPVILTDLREAEGERFRDSAVLRAHNVVSGITVEIPGAVNPFGVLSAHDRVRRRFTDDDVHFLQAIAHIIGTAAERSRSDAAFRQAQRLEAVGQLAGSVAHDFNNMLTAITGFGEIIRSGLSPDDPIRADIQEILGAADRAASLTRQLLAFSRQQLLKPRLLDLNDVVREVEKMLRRLIGSNIQFVTRLDPGLGLVMADPGQMEQVLLNLCVNARDAMPDGGTLRIETENAELDAKHTAEHSIAAPGQFVMLAVSDTGVGMDAETRARVYEPFFTTKGEKGTGLGLATVYGIVKQSRGEIWLYSEPGQGTTFKVYLPLAKSEEAAEPVPQARPSAAPGSETILLAEDEDAVRRLAQRVMEKAGYKVLVAANGEEALAAAEAHSGPIHLVVTDMMMPRMTGLELAQRIAELRPETRTLFLSGYTDAAITDRGVLEGGANFLQKPFTRETLIRKIREALEASSASL